MSFVKKYLFNTFNYKNISACSYLINDVRVNCAQYFTCINNPTYIPSMRIKYKTLEQNSKRDMCVLQSLKETNYNFTMKLRNFVETFPTYFPFFGQKYRKYGYFWFKTLDEINTEDFFSVLKLPDSFYSRFQIIELHVWMLLYHLPKKKRTDRFIRLGVIQAMWEDSQKRAKLVAQNNINYKKDFRSLYGEFLFSQLFYDYCISKSDAALSSAVWCSFYNKQDVDPRFIEALVSYIRYQMHHLNKLNLEKYNEQEEKCKIWAPARPHFEDVLTKL